MKRLLLDTSVIIDFLRMGNKQETLFYKLAQEEISISVITHTELYAGKSVWKNEKAREELETLFSGITILPLTQEISTKAGEIKAIHHNIGLLDCIIGATAMAHDLPLVTLNIKDFEHIVGVTLYNITN